MEMIGEPRAGAAGPLNTFHLATGATISGAGAPRRPE